MRLSKEREAEIRAQISKLPENMVSWHGILLDEIDELRIDNDTLLIRLERYETDTTLDANLVKTMENQLWLHAEKIAKLEAENAYPA